MIWRRVQALLLSILVLFTFGWTCASGEEDEDTEETELDLPEKPVGDPLADLETKEEWDRMFASIPRSGDRILDFVTIAESQVGYSESSLNFEAKLNAAKDGYDLFHWTRYGAWYGYPYGDWCAMYISFCLYYAGIPQEVFPYDSGTVNWADTLKRRGQYHDAGGYTPKQGDIVFFDWEEDYRADHCGIVCSYDATTGALMTVEGNRTSTVDVFEYGPGYGYIMGYGVLPESLRQTAAQDQTQEASQTGGFLDDWGQTDWAQAAQIQSADWTATAGNFTVVQSYANHIGGITIYIEAGSGALPDDTDMTVSPFNGMSLKDTLSGSVDGEVLEVQALHILFHEAAGGSPVTLKKPVRVTMYPQSWNYTADHIHVFQICDDGTVNHLRVFDDLKESATGLRFEADRSAVYAIAYSRME